MKNRFFRLCSLFLVLVLLVNMLPMSIFAEEFKQSLTAQETVSAPVEQVPDAHVVAELTDKRTQYTKEFLLSNGLHLATVYADPVHYEKDGQWAEIDNTLVAKSDGTLHNTDGVWNVSFPNQLSGSNSVSIEKDGYTLSFTMAGELRSSGELMTAAIGTEATEQLAVSQMQAATASIQSLDTAALEQGYMYPEAAPTKLDSQLRYNDIYANTDVVYDLQSDTVKESIVMASYSSTLRGYRYTLNVGQLTPVLSDDGEITFFAPDKETVVMVMPAPYLLDANNEYNDDIQVQLTGKDGTYTLSYLLPRQWLAEEERAWPVILDPVVKASRDKLAIRDQTVCEKKSISQTKTVLDAGYSEERGKIRAYLKYLELPPLTSSDVVVQALFTLHKVQTSSTSKTVEVHKVENPWPDGSLNWTNQPGFRTDISDFRYVQYDGLHSWMVTEIVRSWYTDENNGLMIKMSNDVESGASGDYFRQFYSSDTGKYNRPTLQVVFLNNNGLEGYWDYTTTSAGRAGTGYVNNFTGNLVWVRNDMGFGGNRMPVSIDHVYNANDAIVYEDAEGQVNNANDSGGNYFGLGVGWRTNYHQRVFQWKCDDATGDSNYYIWEDGDGTDHYFKKSSTNTYKDEENLSLTLKTNLSGDNAFSITEKKGNTSFFDSQGRLTKIQNKQATPSSIDIRYKAGTAYEIDYITDGAGRKYVFTYDDGLLSSIVYYGTTDDPLRTVVYKYEDSLLKQIIDNPCENCANSEYCGACEDCVTCKGWKICQSSALCEGLENHENHEDCNTCSTCKGNRFIYNQDGILKSVTDIDGYKVTYEYTRDDNIQTETQDETTTTPLWEPPYLVESIATEDDGVDGGSLEFTYGYNETRMEDYNNNAQTIQFNDWGNVVGIMDDEGHAQYAKYTANAHTDTGKANQLTFSSKLQNTVGNLLNDSSFENGTLWTVSGESTQSISTSNKYYGAKSLHVSGRAYSPSFTIAPGETYTASGYIKSLCGAAELGILAGTKPVYSRSAQDNEDWARYEVSYTNTGSTVITAKVFLDTQDVQGAYLDCVQLEKSPTASRYNLVENGDFRVSSGWTLHDDCTSLDIYTDPVGLAPAAPQLDGNCFSITGNRTKTKNIYQTVKVSGKEGDSFVFAGWAAGYAVPQGAYDGDTRRFAVRARFKYTDGKYSDYFYANFQPTIQDDKWQYTSKAMVAKKDYTEITIGVVYHYNVNTVYFDGIQLFKEEFGTSYTYDEDGNVVSSVDLQKKNTTYDYDKNTGDLLQILEDNKAKVTYTYDEYHNVKTAKTEEGLKYTFTYDGYGNNTSVSIGDGDTKITSSATYTANGNYTASTTDALGKITAYEYDTDKGVLLSVQYPEDEYKTKVNEVTGKTEVEIDTRTKYDYDSMFRTASAVCDTDTGLHMSANYTYEDDYLISVATPTTTYGFTYGDFGLRDTVTAGNYTLASYTYDKDYYLQKLDYGNGDSVEYEYDKKGRVEKEIRTDVEKDENGNLVETADTVQYLYNNDGNLAKVIDSATGRTTTYFYDLLDRMVKYEEKGTNYSHSVSYEYDKNTNLSVQVEVTNGVTTTIRYTYDDDNRIKTVSTGSATVAYTYDTYGRVSQKVTKNGETAYKTETYTYKSSENGGASSQVDTHKVVFNQDNQTYTYRYTYDNNGNILTVNDGTNTINYMYDSANQLIRESNLKRDKTSVWTYDNAGNIVSRAVYGEYLTDTLDDGTLSATVNYGYTDPNWGDLLTSYDGKAIVYDAIGNPTSIGVTENGGGRTYTWEHGRQLSRLTEDGTTWEFQYNADGIRTKRTNGTTTYEYTYNGSQLTQMKVGTKVLNFTYDANGMPMTVTMDGNIYYYVTNVHGDVIRILDSDGCDVACYTYDAWGVCDSAGSDSIGQYNPLRYRGYVYDDETQLYYLQSRYYDPGMGRFINADNYPTTGQGLTGNNMFAYCGNNPVSREDDGGELWNVIIGAAVGAVVSAVTTAIDSYASTGSVDWGKVGISAAVGAVSGGVAATGLGMVAQAGITAAATFVGDVATQKICEKKSWSEVNYLKAAHNGVVAGGTSLVGSVLGGITSSGHTITGNSMVSAGKNKMLTGYVRKANGQSYSKLLRQGRQLVASGTRYINTGRGISSVTGTFLTWGVAQKYSWG